MQFLAEHFSADFATWLLGEPVALTELKPSELSLDPIRADALILLESDKSVLHIEFQTLPKQNIPFRYRILRRDVMQESTIYRSIQKEAQEENTRMTVINLLHRGVAIDIIASSTGFSIQEVQQLQQQFNEFTQN